MTGKTPAALYAEALAAQPEIAALLSNATQEKRLQTCKDWSHLADRIVGPNWFVAGEAAGIADPILAAGMSLARSSAREAAYTIIELERGEHNARWLRDRYNDRNRLNIQQHIRFAQYGYAANGRFTDLQDHCQAVANEAGLTLAPNEAWHWLSQGGFATEQVGAATFGSFDIASTKQLLSQFDSEGRDCAMLDDGHNVFTPDLREARRDHVGVLRDGRIERVECYRRGARILPMAGYYGALIQVLQQTGDGVTMFEAFRRRIASRIHPDRQSYTLNATFQALEVMVQEGWVKAGVDHERPLLRMKNAKSQYIRDGAAGDAALAGRSRG